jgi:hypothetical protein
MENIQVNALQKYNLKLSIFGVGIHRNIIISSGLKAKSVQLYKYYKTIGWGPNLLRWSEHCYLEDSWTK